jgi:predicted CoA-binding protein
VYKRLREHGYAVSAVNPNAATVEGDPSYQSLEDVPGGVEAVVIGTRPELAEQTMKECIALGITKVWMHRAFGGGSVSDVATELGRAHGITVIDGGCPCMFRPTDDGGHRFMRVVVHSGRNRSQEGVSHVGFRGTQDDRGDPTRTRTTGGHTGGRATSRVVQTAR